MRQITLRAAMLPVAAAAALGCAGSRPRGTVAASGPRADEPAPVGADGVAARQIAFGAPFVAPGPPAAFLAAHGCAVMADATLRCFDIADGETVGSHVPVPVAGLTDVAHVGVGLGFTCAVLRAGGRVVCWGANTDGALGDGSFAPHRAPVAVRTAAAAREVHAGARHACALLVDGTVQCWGRFGRDYQYPGAVPTPERVEGLADVAQLAVGAWHDCALTRAGKVRCWGGMVLHNEGTSLPAVRPTEIAGLRDVRQVAVGGTHACALHRDGTVTCWGENVDGAAAPGETREVWLTPVAGVGDAVEIALGDAHSCARLRDGTVRCWGRNADGQLGDGTRSPRTTPVAVAGLTDAAALALGPTQSCAFRRDGATWCWGAIGDAAQARRRSRPALVPGVQDARQIALGESHACARRGDGAVVCWGDNARGQLGDPTRAGPARAAPVPGLAAAAVDIAAGSAHTCAALATGALACWGASTAPAAFPAPSPLPRPTPIAGATDVVQVAASLDTTCVRRRDGSARCDAFGELLHPAAPAPGSTAYTFEHATRVFAGLVGGCATQAGGALLCWTAEYPAHEDSAAFGPTPAYVVPPRTVLRGVDGIPRALDVAAGASHECVVRDDGAVLCVGSNRHGELGAGLADLSAARWVRAAGLDHATQVAAGANHTCARTSAGEALCWGGNDEGQLGDGTTRPRRTPARVPGLAGVEQIAAGAGYTCARLRDGTVRCWGGARGGRLGDGAETASPRARPVTF